MIANENNKEYNKTHKDTYINCLNKGNSHGAP